MTATVEGERAATVQQASFWKPVGQFRVAISYECQIFG